MAAIPSAGPPTGAPRAAAACTPAAALLPPSAPVRQSLLDPSAISRDPHTCVNFRLSATMTPANFRYANDLKGTALLEKTA